MKKILLIILFLLFFVVPEADARRGCCSHHHGVKNCDTLTGRLVCNDGTYSPTCKCEYDAPTPVHHVKKSHKTKIEIIKNYDCQTMIITERLATYYKYADTKINLGAIPEKTQIVKTGNFKNNMFEVKIKDHKDRVWIKKDVCSCL